MYFTKNDKNANFLLSLPLFNLKKNLTPEHKYNLWLKCLAHLGNPQESLQVIQVVGTNGKGSTSMYLQWFLQEHYAKIGTFTSPATITFYDRIQINNIPITAKKVSTYLKVIKPLIEEYCLNFFSVWTLIAVMYFKENQVNIAIFEAGIGGRIDSTNIFFQNQLAVILTSVSLDHQNILGDTIEKIMLEKLAIIQPVSKLFVITDLIKYQSLVTKYSNDFKFVKKLKLPNNIAQYQSGNLALSFAVAQYLTPIKKINFQRLPSNIIFGRFSKISTKPIIILDGAHNPEAIKVLIAEVKKIKTNFTVLAGFSKNKNIIEMQKLLNKNFTDIHYLNFNFSRSHIFNNQLDYRSILIKNINLQKPLLITGSLYFINEVYLWLKQQKYVK